MLVWAKLNKWIVSTAQHARGPWGAARLVEDAVWLCAEWTAAAAAATAAGSGEEGGARVRFNFGLARWKDSRVSKKLRVSLYGSFRGGKAALSRENGCNPEPDTGTPRPEEGRENTPGQVSVRSGFRGPGRGPVIAVQIGPRNGPPWRLRDREFGPPKCRRVFSCAGFSQACLYNMRATTSRKQL